METLPAPNELLANFPPSLAERDFVLKSRQEICQILKGEDSRLLLIVGPCSLHDFEQSLEYAKKLKALSKEVEKSFLIIMRAYFEKPRTALGWRGLLHDPALDGSCDIRRGLYLTRQLFQALTQEQMPIACEFLDPASHLYFSDFVSWGCIGARTSTSQIHRQMASQLPFPVGFKNGTDGSITTALHGIEVAQSSQIFLGTDANGRLSRLTSPGNPYAHLVLRGGESSPNYTEEHLEASLKMTPYVIVDCSHDNSRKQPQNQITIFRELCQRHLKELSQKKRGLRGLMLESFLNGGSQPMQAPLKHGISITDPCLDFETTAKLIREAAEELNACALS